MNEALEIIEHIDPTSLTYEEWLHVGMVLKDSGCTAADWDAWSRADTDRYVGGECFKKWESFRGTNTPVKIGTIAKMAKDHGWTQTRETLGKALEWDAVIGGKHIEEVPQLVDSRWVQDEEVPTPDNWNPTQDLITYLSVLFNSDEHVGYVTESWYNEKAGRYLPKKGCYDRTAGELIEALQKCDGDIGQVLGDYNPEVGAWIRFNPVDGQGIRDENVTAYRFALIESDEIPVDKQYALIQELELPVAALVHSGGKSLHAIVRVDADNYDEYRKRVDFLYEVCERNGLNLDRQNRNPSRLSRMPGVTRNGERQYLVATNIGKSTWAEWDEHVQDLTDSLPDIEELTIGDTEPKLAPELVTGILREGHKLLLSGPSKAGKSFALLQLCMAIAEGKQWFGRQVAKGRVLYVNLELDKNSCLHRFWKIYQDIGIAGSLGMIDVWNLRGHATAMDRLAPKLIRRSIKRGYKAVVIDPIYKVLTGDENSADQMAHFCNQFDKICTELGVATIYCHHHSKGAQGQKNSRDRSSGSGVFARDPDAILDMIELSIDEDRRKQIVNVAERKAISAMLDAEKPNWDENLSQDDALSASQLAKYCNENKMGELMADVRAPARQRAELETGWRIEGTVREFPAFAPIHCFFDYPIHRLDTDGLLKDAKADGEEAPWVKTQAEKKKAAKDRSQEQRESLENAYEICNGFDNEKVTVSALAQHMEISEKTVYRRIGKHPMYAVADGVVTPINTTQGQEGQS